VTNGLVGVIVSGYLCHMSCVCNVPVFEPQKSS
jgi:hypothetical protein